MVPENMIQEFVTRARDAAGENLESIILYGSAASGGYDDEFSDLNFFCVLRDTSFASLARLGSLAKWWSGKKQPPPLLMTRAELEASTDVFTIELMDMQRYHRALFGEDVLATVQVPLNRHRTQVEYELREKLLLLRNGALLAADKESRLWELLLHSVASFLTLFRHALIACGQPAPGTKRETLARLSEFAHFDAAAFQQVLEVREHKLQRKNVDVSKLFAGYLDTVEKVTAAVDKAPDLGLGH